MQSLQCQISLKKLKERRRLTSLLTPIKFIVLSLVFFSSFVRADFDVFDFAGDVQKEARYQRVIHQVRCPKCQNQNISGSDAPISKDLRAKVHELIMAGKTDAEIYAYLVARYGDFVLYRPPVRKSTWLLWFGPPLLLVSVLLVLFLMQREKLKKAAAQPSDNALDDASRARLAKLKALKK